MDQELQKWICRCALNILRQNKILYWDRICTYIKKSRSKWEENHNMSDTVMGWWIYLFTLSPKKKEFLLSNMTLVICELKIDVLVAFIGDYKSCLQLNLITAAIIKLTQMINIIIWRNLQSSKLKLNLVNRTYM